MFRTAAVLLFVVVGVPSAPSLRAETPSELKLGEKFEGELTEEKGYSGWPGFVDTFRGYAAEMPISLKAGQKITISATVLGTGRKVSVALLDPTGKIVAATRRSTAIKTVQLTAEEVNATGKYTIAVISDQIGAFILRATGPAAEELDARALEEKIKRLKKELEEAEAALKALKSKTPKPIK